SNGPFYDKNEYRFQTSFVFAANPLGFASGKILIFPLLRFAFSPTFPFVLAKRSSREAYN
ncbi:MAG: hypothetical protein IJ161_01630, partial [Bacteroidales bacterium]|nr:hypothetical protein [Bacteroidales bacterium]